MPTAANFKDYYAILGVSKTATPEEIKRVYRKLARKYHSDLNLGDKDAEAKFKELNDARSLLKSGIAIASINFIGWLAENP